MTKQNRSLHHEVNVFSPAFSHYSFHISCENCKLKKQCEPIKHKREFCEIANKTRKLLAQYTFGYVSSFCSDDFYIKLKSKNCAQKQEIKKAILKIWSKYAVKTK